MSGLVEVFGGVLVLGRIAATDMAADQAQAQVDPGISHLEAFLATFAAGRDFVDLLYVRACWCL
jgi:hypothetical protein